MKLILTGATGTIGRGALDAALSHSGISTVVALVRREITDEKLLKNPKLKVVVVRDFTQYSPEEVEACEGAEGCVW